MVNVRFPAVGGHVGSIFYGENTAEGYTTLQKSTTAWEIIYYIGMYFSKQLLLRPIICDISSSFLRSMEGLKLFTPRFFAARVPEAWAPRSDALRREIERLGGMQLITRVWLKASDEALEELWIFLFLELFEGSSCVRGWSEAYDQTRWGLSLVDETSSAQEPAVMDVKIGTLRYSPHTPKEKVTRIDRKEEGALCRKVALRLCGFRRFIHPSPPDALHTPTKVEELEKQFGFSMREDELSAVLRCFPSTVVGLLEGKSTTGVPRCPHHVFVKDCLNSITQDRRSAMQEVVEGLLYFFQETTEGQYLINVMAFVSTSLLFLYDAAGGAKTVKVCLIDFSRSSCRHLNYDEETIGFIKGLQNMVQYLNIPVCPPKDSIQPDKKDGS
ncbi:unnamed protein product [Phytomonas sp. Hart1]|nr:unnamed protein product [Phytomonas sp. Hart1]|eukprot:CCW69486.1 unnamed protein product [Phytomonas sp. isolate Hart1]